MKLYKKAINATLAGSMILSMNVANAQTDIIKLPDLTQISKDIIEKIDLEKEKIILQKIFVDQALLAVQVADSVNNANEAFLENLNIPDAYYVKDASEVIMVGGEMAAAIAATKKATKVIDAAVLKNISVKHPVITELKELDRQMRKTKRLIKAAKRQDKAAAVVARLEGSLKTLVGKKNLLLKVKPSLVARVLRGTLKGAPVVAITGAVLGGTIFVVESSAMSAVALMYNKDERQDIISQLEKASEHLDAALEMIEKDEE